MRFSIKAATVFSIFSVVFATSLLGQPSEFAITNYEVVDTRKIAGTQWYVEARAHLWNNGAARSVVSATISSQAPTVRILPGRNTLQFSSISARNLTLSDNTFAMVVDGSTDFDAAVLRWRFTADASGPSADAGPPQTASVGSRVFLDASRSTALRGGGLSFNRRLLSVPPGSNAVITNPDAVVSQLELDAPGAYEIELTVSNANGSDSDVFLVTTGNSPPVADPGSAQTVPLGAIAQLDGSGSTDADGDQLRYLWKLISVPALSKTKLMDAQSVAPSFLVDAQGTYVAELRVSDGKSASAPATVRVDTRNSPPTAVASVPAVVPIGSIVRLRGSDSTDVDGDPLQYSWALTSRPPGSTATLSNPRASNPFFTADRPGDYVAQLVVRDGLENSQPATVLISTEPVQPPTADAGPNQTVDLGELVTLNGSGSDPQGLPLTFQWSLISKPDASNATLANDQTRNPSFVADANGRYIAQLVVSNEFQSSDPATVTIGTSNSEPIADPGPQQVVPVGSTVNLDGSGSSDPDDDPLTYDWALIQRPDGSAAELSGPTSVMPTFVADLAGSYTAQLIVSDPFSSSDPATVDVIADSMKIDLSPDPLNLLGAPGTMAVSVGSPAPAGGLTIDLSADLSGVVSIPAQVVIPEGSSAANFDVTPVGVGTTTLTAASSGYLSGVATVSVSPVGAFSIGLPVGVTLDLGETAAFPVTLTSPAPLGGVVVSLSSSDPSKVTINPGTATIDAGETQPAAQPTVSGLDLGAATISASAPGYAPAAEAVNVSGALGFNPAELTIVGETTETALLELSGPAPAGGLTVNLASSDPSIATTPPTATFPAGGATSVETPVTALQDGMTTITASGPNLTPAVLDVTVVIPVDIELPVGLEVSPNRNVSFPISLVEPAQGPTFVRLQVDNPSIASLSQTSILINAGALTPTAQPTLTGLAQGEVTVTATATGLTTARTSVRVRYELSFIQQQISVVEGETSNAALVLSSPAPTGGLTVNLSSSDESVATTAPTATFGSGSTAATVSVTGVAAGDAVVSASGADIPEATVAVSVTPPDSIILPVGLEVGLGQTVEFPVELSSPAPVGGATVTLTSGETSIAQISPTTIFIPRGQRRPASQPQLLAVNVGFVDISASAPGFGTTTEEVSIEATLSFDQQNYAIEVGEKARIGLSLSGSVPFGLGFVQVDLESTNPAVAPVPAAVLNFHPDGSTFQTVVFQVEGLAEGRVTIKASGLNIPEVTATVTVGSPITITTAGLPEATVGASYSATLDAVGGSGARTWSASGGAMPSGLTLDPSAGTISGTPAGPGGEVALAIQVADSSLPVQTHAVTLPLSIRQLTPASIEVAGGSPQSAVTSSPFSDNLTVRVLDAEGQPVPGALVSFAAPVSGASGSFAGGVNTAITDSAGVAFAPIFTANDQSGSYSVTASVTGVDIPAVFSLTNNAAARTATIEVSGGSPQSAPIDSAFLERLAVTVRDADGQPMEGATVTFAPPASGPGAAFEGALSVLTDASGLAVAPPMTANMVAGSYTVSASVAEVPGTATFQLLNEPGAPVSIEATSGSSQSAAISQPFAQPLVATVRDAGNNGVPGVTVVFQVPETGASGDFAGGVTTAVTDDAGVAASPLLTANDTMGSFAVTATVDGVAGLATFDLNNAAGLPASIEAVGGTPQTAFISEPFAEPFSALVLDADSNPVPGITVVFTGPVSGASGTFAGGANTAVTDASGIATSTVFTANEVSGSYTVLAVFQSPGEPGSSSGGVVAALAAESSPAFEPARFQLTNDVRAPAFIQATGGTPQSAPVNTAFPLPLQVTVLDADSNPAPNVLVTFTAPPLGASGTFEGGGNVATTNASGVATSPVFTANAIAGSYTVEATVPGVPLPATFQLTNTTTGGGPPINVENSAVGVGLQRSLTVSLSTPAPLGGVDLTLTSSDPSVLLVGRQVELGDPLGELVVTIPQGLSIVAVTLQGIAEGSTQLTASAPGYTAAGALIEVTPSAFVVAGPEGIGTPFSVSQGIQRSLTISPARLDSNLNFVETQQLVAESAVNVPLTSTTPSVGSVSPASVTLLGGQSTVGANFTAVASGGTTLIAEVPTGFSQPADNTNQLDVTVTAADLVAPDATVGQHLQTSKRITLNGVAPPGDLILTVTSNDPTALLLSNTANGAGSASINLTVPEGFSLSPQFYLQALEGSGTADYTATGPGFGSGTGTVTLTPSGFVLASPFGLGADFFTTLGSPAGNLTVVSARLDANLNYVGSQTIRGGHSVDVTVTSSDTGVGTITTSPVTIAGGDFSAATQFQPLSGGFTTLAVAGPAPFSIPAQNASLEAEVRTPPIALPAPLPIGNNLQRFATALLGAPAPAGGLQLTISSNSAQLLLADGPTVAGSPSIILTVPEGQSSASFYLQARGEAGTVTYTASAPGFSSATGDVLLAPSGVAIRGPFGFGFPLITTVAQGVQPVTVQPMLLQAGTNLPLEPLPLSGGMTLEVSVTNSDPTVGTVPDVFTIQGGSDAAIEDFTPLQVGQTTLGVIQPAGYTMPLQNTTLSAQVN